MSENRCPCKRMQCERHGNCEACRAHHREQGKLTRCEKLESTARKQAR